jgi:hypothetical protein
VKEVKIQQNVLLPLVVFQATMKPSGAVVLKICVIGVLDFLDGNLPSVHILNIL